MSETGLILLAAGASTRLGRLKQLVSWRGTTLIRHAVGTALATPFRPIVVVLGCEADRIGAELADLPVEMAINPDWALGMGDSLATGVAAIQKAAPALHGLVIALPDQPFVTAEHLIAIAALGGTTAQIVAASYRDIRGVPAYFPRRYFPELLALEGEAGARFLLQRHAAQVHDFPLPAAAFDLDTPADYARLSASENKEIPTETARLK